MRPKSLILLAMALGCGLVAAVGINQIMARPSTDVETTSIVVAKKEVLKGDLIKPDDIRLQEWRKDALPEGAIEKIEDLQDKRVRSTIIAGEPILLGKLIDGKGDNIDIPPGMKSVTVKGDNETFAAGLIRPGDNVDVLVHAEKNEQRGVMQTITRRLLSNVKVLAVDENVERPAPGEPPVVAKTISLLVSEKDAMRVSLASEIGKIRLIMRSARPDAPDDDASAAQQQVSIHDVLGGGDDSSSSGGNGSTVIAAATPPNITPLPPTGPSLGEAVSNGANGLLDIIKEMNKAKTHGLVEEKKPWKVVLLNGPEAKEVEFSEDSKIGRDVTGGAPSEESQLNNSLESKLNLNLPPTGNEGDTEEKVL